jgi:hypothetical protein
MTEMISYYLAGMNVVVATRPGQQEAATTPGASAHGMEARHARQVAESEGDEAVVSTRSGEGSLVAKIVRTRYMSRKLSLFFFPFFHLQIPTSNVFFFGQNGSSRKIHMEVSDHRGWS